MGVPTVSSVSPNTGRTGGQVLTVVTGTNFQLPPIPPATGKTTAPKASIRVKFTVGAMTRESPRVVIPSTTQLYVVVPPMDPGVATMTVENIDQNGVLVPGETVTVANAYTFKRPDLVEVETDSALVRVIRTLLRDLKRQVHENVSLTIHTDYDADTGDGLSIIEDAELPSVVLVGPTLRENRIHSPNKRRQVQSTVDATLFSELRPSRVVDLVFTATVASESDTELFALVHEMTAYLTRNFRLRMDRDSADPTKGEVTYELVLESDFDVTTAAGESNLRNAQARFSVRAVALDERDMVIARGKVLADVILPGGASTQEPSPVIIGSDVLGQTVVGQDPTPLPGDTTGGANDPPPGGTVGTGLDYEQKL